jgi:bifunctional DNA-binding transcriptional regulator/antitoxin component of YhaV-PrlF toxin-antitoxin module
MSEQETVREVMTLGADGRMTIPDKVRRITDLINKKAFCTVENYGRDKILIIIESRWTPSARTGPGRDFIKT